MKFINFNFLCALILLCFKQDQFILTKSVNNNKNLSSKLLDDIKDLKVNMTGLFEDLSILKNTTYTIYQNKTELQEDENVKTLVQNIDDSIVSLKNFHSSLDKKIKDFEENLKHPNTFKKNLRKKKKDDEALNFYNSLSLIMLSLLAGGLVGVIFILYFSFRSEDKQDNI
jgi:hypothetical protein